MRIKALCLGWFLVGCRAPHDQPARRDSVATAVPIVVLPETPDTPPTTVADTALRLLFAINGMSMNSLALLGDSLRDMPSGEPGDEDYDAFVRDWLAPGTTFRLLRANAPVGQASVLDVDVAGCAGVQASVRVTSEESLRVAGRLATNVTTLGGSPVRMRDATPEERGMLARAARALVPDSVPDSVRALLQLQESQALFLDDGRPALLGVATTEYRESLRSHLSVVVLLETRDGSYTTTLAVVDVGHDESVVRRAFLDVLQLLGDATPEIITRNSYYESFAFSIFTRRDGQWHKVYTGGGGGC